VFVLAAPQGDQGGAEASPPYPATETPDLSEGPHMGYALQWFGFAAVLAIGYPLFVKKQLTSGS
jgi:surfeit locus 1 family protein